jgi:hypothetical protein
MKHIDYLYFNIYNYFHHASDNFNTRIQAMYLFSIGSGGWVLLLESTYLHLVRHSRFSSKLGCMIFAASVYLLTAFVFNYVFIVRERDLAIFDKYGGTRWYRNPNRNRDLVISFVILALPYLLMLLSALVFPRRS